MAHREPQTQAPSSPSSDVAGKRAALDVAIASIEKQFGKGSIMTMGGEGAVGAVELIPTGIISLDIALGGGIPRGRIIEIYGPESSGKTTLASYLVGQVQKRGGLAAFIDAEHAFDPEYAKTLGVQLEDLLVSQPDPQNKRKHITAPTTLGMQMTEAATAIIRRSFGPEFAALGEDHLMQLIMGLQRLHAVVCRAGKPGACDHPLGL